jgi:hypothetical protein
MQWAHPVPLIGTTTMSTLFDYFPHKFKTNATGWVRPKAKWTEFLDLTRQPPDFHHPGLSPFIELKAIEPPSFDVDDFLRLQEDACNQYQEHGCRCLDPAHV